MKFIMHTEQDMLEFPAFEINPSEGLPESVTVTVLMMTRNHEEYLEQAVQSVLDQNFSLPFELLIGEDFSSDKTLAVAKALQIKHPGIIRLVAADQNVGITANFLRLMVRARGEFIAFLEGDDYWVDSDKLKLQVDLLQKHLEYSWCGGKTLNRVQWLASKPFYSLEDILRRYLIHTSTVMFRSNLLRKYPKFPDEGCWETMLLGYLSSKGDAGFIDKDLSYYRRHDGGLWHNADRFLRIEMSWGCIDALDLYFESKYSNVLIDREHWIYKMDLATPNIDTFWKEWKQSFLVVKFIFPRFFLKSPFRYICLVGQWVLQPIHLIRPKLALGSRMRSMIKLFRQN